VRASGTSTCDCANRIPGAAPRESRALDAGCLAMSGNAAFIVPPAALRSFVGPGSPCAAELLAGWQCGCNALESLKSEINHDRCRNACSVIRECIPVYPNISSRNERVVRRAGKRPD